MRRPGFFTSGTNIAAVAGLLVVLARHFGLAEMTEQTANSLVDALLFVVGLFLRRGVQKAETAAVTATAEIQVAEARRAVEGG